MNNELQHHGIQGQKWGIRRFQPYPSGQRVKGGREVGAATKVQQRTRTSIAESRAMQAKSDADRYRKAVTNAKNKAQQKAEKKIAKINRRTEAKLQEVDKHTSGYQKALDKKAEKRQQQYENLIDNKIINEKTGYDKIKSTTSKAQAISDKYTIMKGKMNPNSTSIYDNATKGPMGQTRSRSQADTMARNGINGNYSRQYNEGKKIRAAEKRQLKRFDTIKEAAEKAKRLSDNDKEHAEALTKKSNPKLSDAQINKIYSNLVGTDPVDQNTYKDYGFKSKREFVENEFNFDKEIKLFNQSSKQYDDIMKRFENITIDDISRKDYKDAKKFIEQAYSGSINKYHQEKMKKFKL